MNKVQVEFVRNYLVPGFELISGAAEDAGTLPQNAREARALWVQTKDSVDIQLVALEQRLRDVDDPNCQFVAERGLSDFAGGVQVRLLAALIDAERATPDKEAGLRSKALSAVEDFEASILNGAKLDALEALAALPEVGERLSIRAELGGALRDMHKLLRA